MTCYLKKRLPHRKTWSNQKISDAELIAVGLARIRFRHPHYPSYTQAYLRIIRLRHTIEELSKRNYRRALVIVDSQPIPVAKFIRRDSCRFAGASTGYGSQGPVYGLKFHAMVSPKGELLDYRLRPANESDYRVALTMTEEHRCGSPIFIGDKAYQSDQFVTPPKKNVRKASLWKPEYARLRKRVETVFSQLVRSHIRLGQTSSHISLCAKVALTGLAHNLAIWGINP